MLYFNHCICYWNNSFRNWKRAEIRTFCRQLYLIFASTHLLINQSFLICSNIFAGLMKSIGTITCLMILEMCFSPAYNEKYQQILMMVHMLVDESMCGWHPKTTKVGGLPNYILLINQLHLELCFVILQNVYLVFWWYRISFKPQSNRLSRHIMQQNLHFLMNQRFSPIQQKCFNFLTKKNFQKGARYMELAGLSLLHPQHFKDWLTSHRMTFEAPVQKSSLLLSHTHGLKVGLLIFYQHVVQLSLLRKYTCFILKMNMSIEAAHR